MWLYCWPHVTYHLVRWFPRDNRKKICIVLGIFSFALLVPQFYVLQEKHTTRWCPQHLLELLITSIIFTFFSLGFSVLFMMMNPVPRAVKVAFHIFGLVCFIQGLVHIAYTSQADDCRNNTAALYYLSVAFAWIAGASIIFFTLMLPFWVLNAVKRDSVLDTRHREGICYEPVKCCSCMWHI